MSNPRIESTNTDLIQVLKLALVDIPTLAQLVVAYSGGRDSSVLLHLARVWVQSHGGSLRAVHINHHLQTAAADFERHCRAQCERLDVALTVLDVEVEVSAVGDSGLEAAARAARYRALAENLRPGEILLLGHHRRDQAETFCLQALRGSGPAGLASMPARQRFAQGELRRPLLEVSAEAINAYAEVPGIAFVDDPSNADTRFKRNALRVAWPALLTEFPGAEATLARAAHWQAEALELSRDLAVIDAAAVLDEYRFALHIPALRRLSPVRRSNLLRWWLAQHPARLNMAMSLPGAARLHTLLVQLDGDLSEHFELNWPVAGTGLGTDIGGEGAAVVLRHYRDYLYCLPLWPADLRWQQQSATCFALAGNWGRLNITGTNATHSEPEPNWQCRPLTGADRIYMPGRPARNRKQFFQEAGVPPWLRAQLPALWAGERLVAVGTLWRDAAFWEEHPDRQMLWQGVVPAVWRRCVGRAEALKASD